MLLFSLLLILLSNAVASRRDKSILYNRISIIILIIVSYIAYKAISFMSLKKGIGLYGGLFQATILSHSFHIFIFLISSIIIQLTGFYPRKIWTSRYSSIYRLLFNNFIYYNTEIKSKMAERFRIIEYPLILLFIIIGSTLLISSSDTISIFLSIELQSYGLYLLSTIYRNSELATSAGLTYFLLGGLSSCFILLGISLLYANSGTTNLESYYIIINISDMLKDNTYNIINWYNINYIDISLILISVGFLFKVGAAPFHFWSPDVYDAIPTVVTTFVAIIAKISILIFLLELVHFTNNSFSSININWTNILLISSFLSLLIGTILGLNQYRIKRLYAYSTISHLGFILLALSINKLESIQAFIFYLMQYSISNLNAFILLLSIGFTLYPYIKNHNNSEDNIIIDKNNSPIQFITQLKGYFYINPLIALSLAITIYSFVGIPPLIGFFAKQMILSAALDNGYIFMAIIAILTSVISAVYYLLVLKQIFFDKNNYKMNPHIENIKLICSITNKTTIELEEVILNVKNIVLSNTFSITISVLTLIILLFILDPQEWLSMTNILALLIFNT